MYGHTIRVGLLRGGTRTAALPKRRDNGVHALRHYHASELVSRGVSIRAVADCLGHADPAFTLRVYSHVQPADDDRARSVIDDALVARAGQAWASAGDA
jgi:integrase